MDLGEPLSGRYYNWWLLWSNNPLDEADNPDIGRWFNDGTSHILYQSLNASLNSSIVIRLLNTTQGPHVSG